VSRDDFRRRADSVRAIPLEVVLTAWDAVRDRHDKSRWHTGRGSLSVTGAKFFNWHERRGGGGAIDLVVHLGGWEARQAIDWLWHHLGHHVAATNPTAGARADAGPASGSDWTSGSASSSPRIAPSGHEHIGDPTGGHPRRQLRLPAASLANLPQVRRYLIRQRGLFPTILASLIDEGKLYADARGNAVFLMMAGKPNRPIGAELRGTGSRVWRRAPARMRDTSGSAIRPRSRSCSANPRLTPSVASKYIRNFMTANFQGTASASRQRESARTHHGFIRCWRGATKSTAASTPTSLARRPVAG
jgi:hypothetical protein